MRKFIDGHIAGLLMSSAGDAGTGGGGGGGGTGNAAFLASLPEPLRGNEAFKEVKDLGDLATRYAGMNKPFAEMLPEKIRGEAYFKDIKDLDGLATRALHQAKMIGLDKNQLAVLPKGPDDKEGYENLYKTLGRPEAADKYVVPPRADKAAYSEQEQAFQKAMLPVLHQAGLSQRQVDAIVPAWNAMQDANAKASGEAFAANAKKAEDALRSEWGAAYDENKGLAQQALAHYGSPELLAELEATGPDGKKNPLGDSPQLMRLFAKLGAGLKEDGLLGKGGDSGAGGALSPAEARQQISAKQGDAEFMKSYMTKSHPGHANAVAEMERLYKFANPA